MAPVGPSLQLARHQRGLPLAPKRRLAWLRCNGPNGLERKEPDTELRGLTQIKAASRRIALLALWQPLSTAAHTRASLCKLQPPKRLRRTRIGTSPYPVSGVDSSSTL
jgi:hypothetical protein